MNGEQKTRFCSVVQSSLQEINKIFFEQDCILTTYEKEVLLQLAEACMKMREVSKGVEDLHKIER